MEFKRFGNAFIAHDDDGFLYVVSYYMGSWHPYYHDEHGDVVEIGRYGHGSPDEAKRAADDFARSPG